MRLHFEIVAAGVWQCTERTDIQVRNMPRTRLGRNGFAVGGWAVFVSGREVLTCGRSETKRDACVAAQAYADRDAAVSAARVAEAENFATVQEMEEHAARKLHPGEILAIAGVTAATHVVTDDGHVIPRTALAAPYGSVADMRAQYRAEHPAHPQAAVTAALAKLTAALREQVLAELPPAPAPADPATEDDVSELVDRVVRRAQYLALRTVLEALDGWVATAERTCRAEYHGDGHDDGRPCGAVFDVSDFRAMVNDSAAALNVPAPFRAEAGR
jgi:hypothetical protein